MRVDPTLALPGVVHPVMAVGGGLLVLVGVLQVSGAWTWMIGELRYWIGTYQLPL